MAGFGGGVYYSRINDNFHDFFTEYIPFGEEAVLFLEERDFRKRFPVISSKPRVRDTGAKVTIPSSSGASWRVAEEKPTDVKKSSAQSDAVKTPTEVSDKEKVAKVEAVKQHAPSTAAGPAKEKVAVAETAAPAVAVAPVEAETKKVKVPDVNEPSVYVTYVEKIDPINIKDAENPVVQDLVKIMNDIILVVNADKAGNKFSPVINNARNELAKVGGKIKALRDDATKKADEEVKNSHLEFDRAAKELIRRLEDEMRQQEARWKDEYEEERNKLQHSYEQRLAAETQRQKDLNEQRLHKIGRAHV